jgi:hypothetical protein
MGGEWLVPPKRLDAASTLGRQHEVTVVTVFTFLLAKHTLLRTVDLATLKGTNRQALGNS